MSSKVQQDILTNVKRSDGFLSANIVDNLVAVGGTGLTAIASAAGQSLKIFSIDVSVFNGTATANHQIFFNHTNNDFAQFYTTRADGGETIDRSIDLANSPWILPQGESLLYGRVGAGAAADNIVATIIYKLE